MKARYLTMAAILAAVLTIDVSAQDGVTTTKMRIDPPRWPSNGIAERELGDGQETWPENMFVEYSKGRLIAWVIVSPNRGQAKALDFFSGEVQDVEVKNPGEYNDSFVDSEGKVHASTDDFYYKDPRPGGSIGNYVQINEGSLQFDDRIPYKLWLNVSQRVASDYETVIWRKVPLYCESFSSGNQCRNWASMIGTGLELRDGTMLIVGGKYVFRVRADDLTPVGHAPNLHVRDEADVKRVIDKANRSGIRNAHVFLTEELHLQ